MAVIRHSIEILAAAHHKFQRGILGIAWKENVWNESSVVQTKLFTDSPVYLLSRLFCNFLTYWLLQMVKLDCESCNEYGTADSLLICESCANAYHNYCLVPPLTDIPRRTWRCAECIAKVSNVAVCVIMPLLCMEIVKHMFYMCSLHSHTCK